MYDVHNLVTADVMRSKRNDQRSVQEIVKELETRIYPHEDMMRQYCDASEGATSSAVLRPYRPRPRTHDAPPPG